MNKIINWLFLFFIFTAMIVFHLSSQKFCLGCGMPQAQLLAFSQAYSDPGIFKNDPMVATRFQFPSFYPQVIGCLTNFFNSIDLAVFVVHLLSLFGAFIFTYKIAKLCFKSEKVALMCVFMLPLQYPMFYGYFFHWHMLFILPTHNSLGLAFGLGGLYFFLNEKRNLAALMLSAGAYFHALSIVHLFVILLGLQLFELFGVFCRKETICKREILKKFCWVMLFSIIAGPYLLLYSASAWVYSAEDIKTFIHVNSLDSFPLFWHPSIYLTFASFLSLLYFCWIRGANSKSTSAISWALPTIVGSGILCLVAIIAVHVFESQIAIVLQLNRSSLWICFVGSLFVPQLLSQQWKKGILSKVACFLIVFALFYPTFKNTPVPFCFPAAILLMLFSSELRRNEIILAFLQVSILILYSIIFSRDFDLTAFRLERYFFLYDVKWQYVIPSIVFSISGIYLCGWKPLRFIKYAPLLTAVLLALSVYSLVMLFQQRDIFSTTQLLAWKDAQLWSQKNSEVEDVFITPIWLSGFRIYSKRAPVVEWQDGTQQYFDPQYGKEYRQRLQDLGISPHISQSRDTMAQMSNLPAQTLKLVKKKYRAKFYVTAKRDYALGTIQNEVQLPILFENEFFRIYSLK